MRSILVFIAASLLITSCKKDDKTAAGAVTNNYNTQALPAYTVDGIQDIRVTTSPSGWQYSTAMPITISLHDSTQQLIKVSVTDVPVGVVFSNSIYNEFGGPWSGYPTFTITLCAWSINGTTSLGTYTVKIVTEDPAGNKKTFPFKVTVI